VNTIKTGNNGKLWKVILTDNGVRRWQSVRD
jgi:hypothetical protein